jgi:glycosyltransferase involved in cell wall biosynthesis
VPDKHSTEIKVAFGSVPKDGGTFTFYRSLRPELKKLGIDLRCVSVGYTEANLWRKDFAEEGCELIAPRQRLVKKQSQAFAQWCERENVDIVIAVNSRAILSALPHLPEKIRVVARCANAFDHGYRITLAARERLAAIVAITPRLQRDLEQDYSADPDIMHLIPNGISPELFHSSFNTPRGDGEAIRLGFVGRLEHKQKGVLHLIDVVKKLKEEGVEFELRIAGEGVHRLELEQALSEEVADGSVGFVGSLAPGEVPEFLSAVDVFLFPSHFEGCPNALLEALMAGCVPVSWRLPGITDFVIEEGKTGFLAEVGDCSAFVEWIVRLSNNRDELKRMSKAAGDSARHRLSSARAAQSYAGLFKTVMQEPPPGVIPAPWSQFKVDENFSYGVRDWMPQGLRSGLLKILGRQPR